MWKIVSIFVIWHYKGKLPLKSSSRRKWDRKSKYKELFWGIGSLLPLNPEEDEDEKEKDEEEKEKDEEEKEKDEEENKGEREGLISAFLVLPISGAVESPRP